MKLFNAITKRTVYSIGRMVRETGLAMDQYGSKLSKDIAYLEPLSRHRNLMPLYDLVPQYSYNTYISPNCTIVGEVQVGSESQVWYGAVIRGDLNAVRIGNNTSIGDNVSITTAGSLPTGIPASVNIGNFVQVQNGASLYSCTIDDEVVIGFKSVVLEGAKIERGAVIGPNSVVPPGRLIPAGQLWAGNPVQYVRDLQKSEIASNIDTCKRNLTLAVEHMYEFLPQNSAYLQKQNSIDDVNPSKQTDTNKVPHEFKI
ncbi:Trimeric LpxA-like protein [Pseudocohnilembus persalinus]|uniref:Trimeric LpxA-like protein n=1 Tax=Pseudocohnilembus persalinus TaxID=266149 RepID=A0A0V0QBK4_PSEPJ|nr:Trimeric LpxA-like protein [Pseudocohnilembus persalinus]|eukprot:KRW99553.1 Trimeric LpxA-like protein [Pseudocohnilembus persalinus]